MNTRERFLADNDLQYAPPVPCEFALGDRVLFTNPHGIEFGPFHVIGFAPQVENGRFVYIDFDCAWFPVRPDALTPTDREEKTMSQKMIVPDRFRLKWYSDPGHSWLAVPRWLGDQVPGWKPSAFSYQSDTRYFLEEDEDAGNFLAAFRQEYPETALHFSENHTDADSFVRVLPCC